MKELFVSELDDIGETIISCVPKAVTAPLFDGKESLVRSPRHGSLGKFGVLSCLSVLVSMIIVTFAIMIGCVCVCVVCIQTETLGQTYFLRCHLKRGQCF